jgi:hypothetical protein
LAAAHWAKVLPAPHIPALARQATTLPPAPASCGCTVLALPSPPVSLLQSTIHPFCANLIPAGSLLDPLPQYTKAVRPILRMASIADTGHPLDGFLARACIPRCFQVALRSVFRGTQPGNTPHLRLAPFRAQTGAMGRPQSHTNRNM